jgi:hypothetical protein
MVPVVTHSDLLLSAVVMVSVWLTQADAVDPEVTGVEEVAGTGEVGDVACVGALFVA